MKKKVTGRPWIFIRFYTFKKLSYPERNVAVNTLLYKNEIKPKSLLCNNKSYLSLHSKCVKFKDAKNGRN